MSSMGPQQTSVLCLTALGFLLPKDQNSSPSPRGDLVCSELVAAPPANEVGIISCHAGKQAGAGTGPSKVHRGADEENKISLCNANVHCCSLKAFVLRWRGDVVVLLSIRLRTNTV